MTEPDHRFVALSKNEFYVCGNEKNRIIGRCESLGMTQLIEQEWAEIIGGWHDMGSVDIPRVYLALFVERVSAELNEENEQARLVKNIFAERLTPNRARQLLCELAYMVDPLRAVIGEQS